jgi:hypothetical protein
MTGYRRRELRSLSTHLHPCDTLLAAMIVGPSLPNTLNQPEETTR